MSDAEVSLRPMVLRPGAGPANPFTTFGKGAGFAIQAKKASASVHISDEAATTRNGERIKYSRDFLMEFMEKHTKCPIEVQQLGLTEIVISEESERDQQRQVLLRVAEDISGLDDRDWRTREPAAAAAPAKQSPEPAAAARGDKWEKKEPKDTQPSAAEPKPKQQQDAPAAPQPNNEQLSKIAKAADQGLQAYKPGAALSDSERALRQVKGVLNKLTPEKFERLLQQLLEVITTADILKQTITLVFENAVEQPTYCAMYADLCLHLSRELPSFPPPTGSDKPVAFRQILLNTCQDEFEGTEAAREAMSKMTEAHAREEAERGVKKRTMGNMRLISELYKLDMVKDWIMTMCMEDLLNAPKGKIPPEDNMEAACEMITTAGARLSKSERAETRKKLDDVMKRLENLAQEKGVAARIRFVIKDVQDLRRSGWVPRREVFTAKKLDEVRAQAEAELGMISSSIAASLPTLPNMQQRMGGGMVGDDVPLIPPLRSESEGWGLFPPLRSQAPGGNGGMSALLGDFTARPGPQQQQQQAQPAAAAASRPAAAAAGPAGTLSEDELKRKSESLLEEYTSTLDKKEALTCVRELQSPAFMPKLVEVCLDMVLNSTKEKEQAALFDLIIYLHQQGEISGTDIVTGLATYTIQLEDLSMDFPKAPQQLGQFVGLAVNAGVVNLDVLASLLEGDASVEPKRNFGAAALKAVKAAQGGDDTKLAAACATAQFSAEAVFAADPEFDAGAPSVAEWLKTEGLSAVPL